LEGWPLLTYLAWNNGLNSSMAQSSRVNYGQRTKSQQEVYDLICSRNLPSSWLVVVPVSQIESISSCNYSDGSSVIFENFLYLNVSK